MKIIVVTKPSAREEKIEKCEIARLAVASAKRAASQTPRDGSQCFVVSVKEPAKEGRANWAVERVLAQYFGVPISRVRIVSGQTSRRKIVEVL